MNPGGSGAAPPARRAPFVTANVLALGIAACGAAPSAAPHADTSAAAVPARETLTAAAARPTIDRLVHTARGRYATEADGTAVHRQLARVARDGRLLRALRGNGLAGLHAAVTRELYTHGAHIVRIRVSRGGRTLADVGGPFVVAAARGPLRDTAGATIGTLEISIQDVIGFVRYMHRNHHVDVLVRGRGAGHMQTSLAAAARVPLPASGTTTVGGRAYAVRSFSERGFAGEPLRVWVLVPG